MFTNSRADEITCSLCSFEIPHNLALETLGGWLVCGEGSANSVENLSLLLANLKLEEEERNMCLSALLRTMQEYRFRLVYVEDEALEKYDELFLKESQNFT